MKLRDPSTTSGFVAFTSAGNGVHGFAYRLASKTFTAKTAVNNALDTITISSHGFQTGDLVVYGSDPSRSTTVQLWGFLGPDPTTAFEMGAPVQLPDAPIDGLRSANAYFVVRVDANTIRLVNSKLGAFEAQPVDLIGLGTGTQSFTVPGNGTGITVSATLKASNAAGTGVELSDSKQSWPGLVEGTLTGDPSSLVAIAKNGTDLRRRRARRPPTADGHVRPAEQGPIDPGADAVDIAATVSVNVFTHTVEATIGAGAVLQSGSDVTVTAETDESIQLGSSAEATRNGGDDNSISQYTTATREDTEFALALAIGVFNSNARATVASTDGTEVVEIDAAGDITISSKVAYPLLLESVGDLFNPAVTMRESGLDGFDFLLDGTLGFSSNLFNVVVSSLGGDSDSAAADKFVFGGAIGPHVLHPGVEGRRSASGALINQRTDDVFQSDDRAVSVLATTETEIIEVGHNAAFNLSLTSLVENAPDNVHAIRQNPAGGLVGALKSIVNPFGISGQKGIGAAVLVSIYTVTTVAEILANAKVTTGADGAGLTVAANQDLFGVAVGYTGTQATDFGLNVTLIVATYDTTTRAGIGPGVVIRGGPVTVTSTDDITRYTIAGQLLKTEKVGIGVSIGINIVDRDNTAYIGRADTTTAVPTTLADIEVSGPVSVTATTGGELVQVVVGGGIALPEPDERTVPGRRPTSPPQDRLQLTLLLTVSVAVNDIRKRNTRAYVEYAHLQANGIDIKATTTDVARAITVAASFAISKSETMTRSLGTFTLNLTAAGAISVNNLVAETSAELRNSDADAEEGDLLVVAKDTSTLAADGGGVAIAISLGDRRGVLQGSIGIAVGVNVSANTVTAKIDTSSADAGGDVVVHALANTRLEAFTIAFAVSAGAGGGTSQGEINIDISGAGSGSGNSITTTVNASIVNATRSDEPGIQAGGGVHVHAQDTSTIMADAGAFAFTARFETQAEAFAGAVGLSAARNNITSTVDAAITNSTVFAAGALSARDTATDATGAIVVEAISQPTIDALTIAGAGTLGQGAGAGAGSGNYIVQITRATISGGSVVAEGTGAIKVSASDTASITADAGGIGIAIDVLNNGSDLNLAIGIGIAINDITQQVHTNVTGATVTANGDVSVTANASATIDAFTFGAAVGVANASASSAGAPDTARGRWRRRAQPHPRPHGERPGRRRRAGRDRERQHGHIERGRGERQPRLRRGRSTPTVRVSALPRSSASRPTRRRRRRSASASRSTRSSPPRSTA